MSTVLVDDTRGKTEASHKYMFPFELEELFKLKTDRHDSYLWAQNLRFLVFDGADSDEGYPSRDDDVTEVTFKDGTKVTMPSVEFEANEPANVDMSSTIYYPECSFCLQWPRFPRRTKPETFRVIQIPQPDETVERKDRPELCTHFLAVSYCCPKDSEGKSLINIGTYRVRETSTDGTETSRLTRAPDTIIDRAIAFAIDNGLRMIWLDQECILQDNDQDRNVGIQAMDLVYEQATATVGILDSCIVNEDYIYAIEVLDAWMKEDDVPPEFEEFAFAEVLTDFLNAFSTDKYHTRAWTFQEMLSASENGMMAFNVAPDMNLTSKQLGLPAESMLFSAQIIPMETKKILKMVRQSQIFSQHITKRITDLQISDRHTVMVVASLMTAVHRLEQFYPRSARYSHFSLRTHSSGITPYGSRDICSAAVASTLLKTRDNSRVADRLAIVANLCGYEVRLDLDKVEKRFTSLTTCITALSLLNGDLSLLTPDIYRPIPEQRDISDALQQLTISEEWVGSLPSWMLPIHDFISSIYSLCMMPGALASQRDPSSYLAKASYFSVPGYLWSVDRCIDMMPVKRLCEIKWRRLLVLRRKIGGAILRHYTEARLHGFDDEFIVAELESLAEAEPRNEGELISNHRDGDQDLHQEHSQSEEERGVLTLSADIIEEDQIARETLADIYWEILSYLQNVLGESAVANSVWHSIRTDCLTLPRQTADHSDDEEENEQIELPDEVSEILAHGKGTFMPLWRALQLDQTYPDDDSYHQIWIIERIMDEGCLWIGNCVTDRRHYFSDTRSSDAETSKNVDKQASKPKSQILHNQSIANNLRNIARALHQNGEGFWRLTDPTSTREPRVYSSTMMQRKDDSKCETRMSVFDVDGPCEIFTPFDADVERLPRPDCRSLSWCWIVERVHSDTTTHSDHASRSQDQVAEDSEDLKDAMRVLDRVKGMWEIMQRPEYNCRFV